MPTRQTKTLRECCQQDGMTADPSAPILRNVKAIGYASKNGRRYTQSACTEALGLYEGCFVNVDHPAADPNGRRTVLERFGRLENCRVEEGDGIRGDLRYNPEHPSAKFVRWFADNMPEALGLSHNAVGQGITEDDGTFRVEKITRVRSVDLVADPATTKGLYESMDDYGIDPLMGGDPAPEDGGHEDDLLAAVSKLLKDEGLSPEEKKKKIDAIMKILHDAGKPDADPAPPADDAPPEKKDAEESAGARVRQLTEELDRYKARERLEANRQKARELCESALLPRDLVTPVFIDQLAGARDDKARKELIEDRRILAGRKPTSAGKGNGGRKMDLNDFASALTGQE